jgi:hypothetical protein
MPMVTTKDGAQYKGLSHGRMSTHHDVISTDLLAFIKS